jgi:ABC-type dipeptide/oligopeptide/nickel transport system permease component
MLDVLNQDYIRTARAKGLSRTKIYYKHALKNTLSIVGTMIAGSIAAMTGGAAVIESVFNIRGMGTLTVDSMGRRDYSQEQAIVIFFAMVFLLLDLLMDLMYKALDPRIEFE